MKTTIRIKQNNKSNYPIHVTNSVLSQIYRSPCTTSYTAYEILSMGNFQARRAAQYNSRNGISLYNCYLPSPCDLLPKNTPYQVCSPWPQFGGLDNTNSRYTPILASQTGRATLLNVSQDLFQANTSPAIANDGTIYIGFNVVTPSGGHTNPASPTQGYLVAFNNDGSVKWRYKLVKPSSYEGKLEVYFDSSTPAIGSDGTIYFGTTTNNPGNLGPGPVASTSVYAINPNGTLKWVRHDIVPADAPHSPPNGSNSVSITASLVIGYDNNLYFGCNSNASITHLPFQSSSLFSLNSATGTTNWEYKLSSSFNDGITITNPEIYDSVAIDNNNNIYLCFVTKNAGNKLVYLISLTPNGTFRYICDLNNGNPTGMNVYGRPVLSVNNSEVFVSSTFQNFSDEPNGIFYLYSINTQSGTPSSIQNISYTINTSLSTNNSMARDNEDNLYFSVVNNNNVVIYSVKNNSINWTYTIYGSSSVITLADCTPAIGSDKTIYFGVLTTDTSSYSNYSVYAITREGKLKWNKLLSRNASIFATSPAIDQQGNVIISVLNGNYVTQTASSSLYSFS